MVKLTEGAASAEKANQAFTVAATAAASGIPVSLWLTGEAVWFAVPGRASSFTLELATPLSELLDSMLSLGTLTVCGQCAARRSLASGDLVPGARIAGAATFVEETLAEIVGAADRFGALTPDEQRTWLDTNFAALRAGALSLEDLP